MKCLDCQSFQIQAEPYPPYDFGHAICNKHNLITDFLSHRKLKKLVCVEDKGTEEDTNER